MHFQFSHFCILHKLRANKGKKAEHLYSALHGIQNTLKRSGMDHTVYLQ